MNRYAPEGSYTARPENREALSSLQGLEKALALGEILEATPHLCDSELCLHFNLGGIPAIMPKEEVLYLAEGGEIKDIAVLTRVGKPVCYKIIGFTRCDDGGVAAVLSRRAAQHECYEVFIRALMPGDIVRARVTHMEGFGAFVDVGCGIVSLLSIDCISVSRISHPSDRFSVGDSILVAIKRIDEAGRIFTTHRELLGTWEENASLFTPGETVVGTVRSIESYGIFVELMPNLAGLAEPRAGVEVGDTAAVYIKSILKEKMKIKLIVIDSYPAPPNKSFRYFIDEHECEHLDRWVYSPSEAQKLVETRFGEE